MNTDILNNELNTRADLITLAKQFEKDLKIDHEIDPYLFLLALMTVESSLGQQNRPRFELAYSRSSLAFKKSQLLRSGYEKWGDLCACSFGPSQILWIVAAELGYMGHPLNLWNAAVSLPYTVILLNKLAAAGGNTLQRLAASYNAGLGALKDPLKFPQDYVKKFVLAYENHELNSTH